MDLSQLESCVHTLERERAPPSPNIASRLAEYVDRIDIILEREDREYSADSMPRWKARLEMYRSQQTIMFDGEDALADAIDVFWSEPFQDMPRKCVGNYTFLIPAVAVQYLRSTGLDFKLAGDECEVPPPPTATRILMGAGSPTNYEDGTRCSPPSSASRTRLRPADSRSARS